MQSAYISLGDLKANRTALVAPAASTASGCSTGSSGKSSCGSSDGPQDMPAEIWGEGEEPPPVIPKRPITTMPACVAVAPACNIQCNYCNRKYDCSNESRPGVVSQKLTPDQAVKKPSPWPARSRR